MEKFEWPDKQMWWGYLHTAGTIHAKRWFGDTRDYKEDCQDSPFVARVVEPFEANNREEAIAIIMEKLNI